jgi:glycosyltransferase involved in cell wall biosynthesis
MSNTTAVIVFRSNLLGLSETFIQNQLLALKAWKPILVGQQTVNKGLPLNDLDVRLLPDAHSERLPRIVHRYCQRFNYPYPPHRKFIQNIRASLIHAHFGFEGTHIWPIARKLKIPLVVTLHGYDINIRREWWESGQGGKFRLYYPRQLLLMANASNVHFIAVSEAIRRRAIEFGIPEEKISVCYIGVNTERFKPSGLPLLQRKKRILFVGRMVEKKGPLILINAFAKIHAQSPDTELVMVGDGPLKDKAIQRAQQLHLNVTFTGALPSHEVRAQLQQARVFCLPSVTAANGDAEGLPIAILEAQSCGVPVITSARGAVQEAVLNRVNGYCVPENDTNQLAASLLELLSNENQLLEFSRAGITHTQMKFDINSCTQQLENLYTQLSVKN